MHARTCTTNGSVFVQASRITPYDALMQTVGGLFPFRTQSVQISPDMTNQTFAESNLYRARQGVDCPFFFTDHPLKNEVLPTPGKDSCIDRTYGTETVNKFEKLAGCLHSSSAAAQPLRRGKCSRLLLVATDGRCASSRPGRADACLLSRMAAGVSFSRTSAPRHITSISTAEQAVPSSIQARRHGRHAAMNALTLSLILIVLGLGGIEASTRQQRVECRSACAKKDSIQHPTALYP